MPSLQLLKHKFHLKIVHYLLTLSQKTDETATDDAENLHVVTEYSLKHSGTTKLYVFFQKMKQLICMQILQIIIISNLSNIRLHYHKTQLLKLEYMQLMEF